MAERADRIAGPYRLTARVEKRWGDDPTTEPYEVIETGSWHEADGTEITDPVWIAELEALVAEKE